MKQETEDSLILVSGRIPSKKNSKNIVLLGADGRTKQLIHSGIIRPILLPSNEYLEWQRNKSSSADILKHKDKEFHKVSITLTFYPPDRRSADLTNKADSIMDLLKDNKICIDDNWFVVPELILRRGPIDKLDPRVEILIQPLPEDSFPE